MTPKTARTPDTAAPIPGAGTRAPAALGLEVAALSAETDAELLAVAEALIDELGAAPEVAAAPLEAELLAESDTEAEAEAEADVELSPVPIPPPIPGRPLMSISSARSPHRSSRAVMISTKPSTKIMSVTHLRRMA